MDLKLNQHSEVEQKLKRFQEIGESKERLEEAKLNVASFEVNVKSRYGMTIYDEGTPNGKELNIDIPGSMLGKVLEFIKGEIAVGQDKLINEAKELMKP